MKALTRTLATLAALSFTGAAEAHPDITMECHLLFHVEDGKVAGIGESWTFDETFSAQLLEDYDEDRDGTFSETETAAIRDETFANLLPAHYFTYLTVDGHEIASPEPFGFRAMAEGGVVTFSFGMKLAEPVAPGSSRLGVEIKDTDFAVSAVMAPSEPLYIQGAPDGTCQTELQDRPEHAYLGGLVVPKEASIRCP